MFRAVLLSIFSLTAHAVTVDFDNPEPSENRIQTFQGIDFNGNWLLTGPYNVDVTNSIYFDQNVQSREFRFVQPSVLNALRVYTSESDGTLRIDDGSQTFSQDIAPGSVYTVTTGWTEPSNTVTVSFSANWNLGITEIVYDEQNPPDVEPGDNKGYALQFFGNGYNQIDRVMIQIDDPATDSPGPALDVGADDFTVEFWLRTQTSAPAVSCRSNNWIWGSIIIDRDRFDQGRAFGIAIAGGVIMFGVDGTSESQTVCSNTNIADGDWHHVAVQRRYPDGLMSIYIDGVLETQADGPDGDISYPDDALPGGYCGGPCVADPYFVIGAEKHDVQGTYSFTGVLDELRVSTVLRYNTNFIPPDEKYRPDADTALLLHFDAGSCDVVFDSSFNATHGTRNFGGSPAGPQWIEGLF